MTEALTAGRAGRPMLLPRITIGIGVLGVLAGAATTPGFASLANARAIVSSVAIVGILAVGMTVMMIGGSLASLSLGTTAAVTAMLFANQLSLGLAGALLVTIVAGAAICAVQGFVAGSWNANPIILTIAAGSIQAGIATLLTGGAAVGPATSSYVLLNGTPLGIPVAIYVLVVIVIAVEFLLRRTTFGRLVYLTGESRPAARAAGLPITWLTTGAFAIAGICAGIAGALLGAYNQGASMQLEGNLTFDVIAAILVGGTLVSGGRGSAWRTLLGALAIGIITNVLLLRGYSTGVQLLFKGVLVGLAVVVVHLATRSEGGRR